jgi:hypothetical protein
MPRIHTQASFLRSRRGRAAARRRAGGGTAAPRLHDLARCGDLDGVQRLLQQAAAAEEEAPVLADKRDRRGRTALHNAAEAGHAEVCAALLDAGATTSLVCADGLTAGQLAALREHEEVAMMLRRRSPQEPSAAVPGAASGQARQPGQQQPWGSTASTPAPPPHTSTPR